MDEHGNGKGKKQDWAKRLSFNTVLMVAIPKEFQSKSNPSVLFLAGLGWPASSTPVLHVGHLRKCVTLGEAVLSI